MSWLTKRLALVLSAIALCAGLAVAGEKVPIVYSTDLFHPHTDPDDHYDLACLFAIAEFDIRGIILDLGGTQAKQPGRPAVEQMMYITGRKAPYGFGLSRPLRSRNDKALEEPEQFQAGVMLLLSVLRQSKEPVTVFTTGSCRDVAAAFNREPELLKKKVKAVYFNIGRGPNEPQKECNVDYDPAAYLRMFESGLPLYWCPCFGKDGFETLYEADQTAVVGACTRPVQNYFAYCLTKSTAGPIAFLTSGPHPLPRGPRAMWCTAPMLHAAGRKVYQRGPEDFVALRPKSGAGCQPAALRPEREAGWQPAPQRGWQPAALQPERKAGWQPAPQRGRAGKEIDAFRFVPMRATLEGGNGGLRVEVQPAQPNGFVFRSADPRYKRIMASCLKDLLAELGR